MTSWIVSSLHVAFRQETATLSGLPVRVHVELEPSNLHMTGAIPVMAGFG
ncbi:MAG: hypothetical protein OXD40_10650 [bacterium]|nr:hypothetical protein [bacterium]